MMFCHKIRNGYIFMVRNAGYWIPIKELKSLEWHFGSEIFNKKKIIDVSLKSRKM